MKPIIINYIGAFLLWNVCLGTFAWINRFAWPLFHSTTFLSWNAERWLALIVTILPDLQGNVYQAKRSESSDWVIFLPIWLTFYENTYIYYYCCYLLLSSLFFLLLSLLKVFIIILITVITIIIIFYHYYFFWFMIFLSPIPYFRKVGRQRLAFCENTRLFIIIIIYH